MPQFEVKVGQIYEETDSRSAGRKFIVESFESVVPGKLPRVIVQDGWFTEAGKWKSGMTPRSRIRIDRLQPTLGKRGYRLIRYEANSNG